MVLCERPDAEPARADGGLDPFTRPYVLEHEFLRGGDEHLDVGVGLGANAHVDDGAIGCERFGDVAHEELGLGREQRVREQHVRADADLITRLEPGDRRAADVRSSTLDTGFRRFVADPVRTDRLPLELLMVVRAQRARVEIPQVVHVDVVLDEQLPIAARVELHAHYLV